MRLRSVFLILLPALLWGQHGTATILGTVTDPTGAAIPNVTVTAKNAETNETRTFLTDAEGFYGFNALLSGTYAVTASAPSFRTATVSRLTLAVNTELRADVTMQLGNIAERVESNGVHSTVTDQHGDTRICHR